eukprot:TRINITY_DN10034_c0_g1_i1.p1 TRINITY_DN10034_c0_g1~~TRINITY_DN10034_c0_g1_i1.p1  ORF type:complete len:851 (-),score=235.78 TRINITY_DN10034_c0_g1_i1:49-2508(-)
MMRPPSRKMGSPGNASPPPTLPVTPNDVTRYSLPSPTRSDMEQISWLPLSKNQVTRRTLPATHSSRSAIAPASPSSPSTAVPHLNDESSPVMSAGRSRSLSPTADELASLVRNRLAEDKDKPLTIQPDLGAGQALQPASPKRGASQRSLSRKASRRGDDTGSLQSWAEVKDTSDTVYAQPLEEAVAEQKEQLLASVQQILNASQDTIDKHREHALQELRAQFDMEQENLGRFLRGQLHQVEQTRLLQESSMVELKSETNQLRHGLSVLKEEFAALRSSARQADERDADIREAMYSLRRDIAGNEARQKELQELLQTMRANKMQVDAQLYTSECLTLKASGTTESIAASTERLSKAYSEAKDVLDALADSIVEAQKAKDELDVESLDTQLSAASEASKKLHEDSTVYQATVAEMKKLTLDLSTLCEATGAQLQDGSSIAAALDTAASAATIKTDAAAQTSPFRHFGSTTVKVREISPEEMARGDEMPSNDVLQLEALETKMKALEPKIEELQEQHRATDASVRKMQELNHKLEKAHQLATVLSEERQAAERAAALESALRVDALAAEVQALAKVVEDSRTNLHQPTEPSCPKAEQVTAEVKEVQKTGEVSPRVSEMQCRLKRILLMVKVALGNQDLNVPELLQKYAEIEEVEEEPLASVASYQEVLPASEVSPHVFEMQRRLKRMLLMVQVASGKPDLNVQELLQEYADVEESPRDFEMQRHLKRMLLFVKVALGSPDLDVQELLQKFADIEEVEEEPLASVASYQEVHPASEVSPRVFEMQRRLKKVLLMVKVALGNPDLNVQELLQKYTDIEEVPEAC